MDVRKDIFGAFVIPRRLSLFLRALSATPIGSFAQISDRKCQHEEAERTLDRLDIALAFFDSERRLIGYNAAYSRMWNLPECWLDTQPSGSKILNQLRESKLLPERRNFNSWIHEHLRMRCDSSPDTQDDLWHLRDGRSISVTSRRYGGEGLVYQFQDVSKKLDAERERNSRAKVQAAMLNALKDGIAIFDAAGRLTLHNNRFAAQWSLSESDLANSPHIQDIALACAREFGCGNLWNAVLSCISSFDAERRGEWETFKRTDGSLVLLSLTRLPDGATMAIISDLVDEIGVKNEPEKISQNAA